MADEAFSGDECQRVRAAAKECVGANGLEKVATELGAPAIAVLGLVAGAQKPTREMVVGLARLMGKSFEEVLGRAAHDPFPNRAEAIGIARREGFSDEAIGEIESQTPAKDRSLVEWILALREAQQRHCRPNPLEVATESSLASDVIAPPALLSEPPPLPPVVTTSSAVVPRVPTSNPAPRIPGIQGEQTGIQMAIASGQAALTLLEYASLSMGLELLPHRREDVFNRYGLKTEEARANEVQAWTQHFAANPRDRRDWQAMRERTRLYWVRFDNPQSSDVPKAMPKPASSGDEPLSISTSPSFSYSREAPPSAPTPPREPAIAAPPPPLVPVNSAEVQASVSPKSSSSSNETAVYPAAVSFPEHAPVGVPVASPSQPELPLETYANICAEIQFSPDRAEEIFVRYGLREHAGRAGLDVAWQNRLLTYPAEHWRWQRLCAERRAALEQEAQRAPALRTPARPPSVAPPTTLLSLAQFALLCVELEKKPLDKESTYTRHGLIDPAKRRSVEEAWRARLRDNPREWEQWQKLVDDIRADWMDL